MDIRYPAEPIQHGDTMYRLVPDGSMEPIYSATAAELSDVISDDRGDAQVIDGHLYLPDADGPPDIWRTPWTYRESARRAA